MNILSKLYRYKKISSDFLYNILASAIGTGTQQLVVYPFFAYFYSKEVYGQLLTIVGVIYVCSVALGNSLNNVRLIQNTSYIEKKCTGDFNAIAVVSMIIAPVIVGTISVLFFRVDTVTLVLICVLTILETAKAYYCVSYRLVLDFLKTLKMSIITAICALLGCLIVYGVEKWPLVFIIADLGGMVYLYKTSPLFKEPFKRTVLFKKTLEKFAILISSGLVSNILTYLDRLVLYPVLGGGAVAIFTVASFFGKTIGVVVMPISSVMLGYYAQQGFKMDNKLFWKINSYALLLSSAFLLVSIGLAKPVTGILYPKLIAEASPYIFLANLGAVINVMTYIVQPAILRFADTRLQLVKEVLYAIVYLAGCVLIIPKYGIYGFCWVVIIANTCKLLFLFIVGSLTLR